MSVSTNKGRTVQTGINSNTTETEKEFRWWHKKSAQSNRRRSILRISKTGLLSSREFVRHITRLRLQSSVEKAQEIVGADCTPFSTSATPTKRVTCHAQQTHHNTYQRYITLLLQLLLYSTAIRERKEKSNFIYLYNQ